MYWGKVSRVVRETGKDGVKITIDIYNHIYTVVKEKI